MCKGLFETRIVNREIRNWNCAISRPWASLDLHRESRNEKCEASQIRDRGGNLNSETRIGKSVPRNLWPLLWTVLRETRNLQSSEFCRTTTWAHKLARPAAGRAATTCLVGFGAGMEKLFAMPPLLSSGDVEDKEHWQRCRELKCSPWHRLTQHNCQDVLLQLNRMLPSD